MIGDVEVSSLKGAMHVRELFILLRLVLTLIQIVMAGKRVWNGRNALVHRRKSDLSNRWALQQLPWASMLSQATINQTNCLRYVIDFLLYSEPSLNDVCD